MSEPVGLNDYYRNLLRSALMCLKRDALAILLAGILFAAAGAGIGKLTNTGTSTAHLALTPLPIHSASQATQEDVFMDMLAAPLDVSTASLLCMSDEVILKTMEKVNAPGLLTAPMKNLQTLKNALKFRVTVATETPYQVVYTPLLQLTAKAKQPADAKAIVNAWSEAVVDAAKRFQEAAQSPLASAFEERTEALGEDLKKCEADSERNMAESSVLYYEMRLRDIIGLITKLKESRTDTSSLLIGEEASVVALTEDQSKQEPYIKLNWTLSEDMRKALESKLGVSTASPENGPASELQMEQINNVYWDVSGKIIATRAGVRAKQATLDQLDKLIADLEDERTDVQAKYAKATIDKMRVDRDLKRIENAYGNISIKKEFARVAGALKHPPVQVISQGAEWPLPRFRRAIVVGAVTGILGVLAAMMASVSVRMVLKPLLKD